MSNQLQTRTQESFSLTPKTLDEAMKYSEMLARSSIVPKNYQGKAGDILVAVQMGHELGLKPIQSLQNIAVINGRPCIYGDACMALVKIHPELEDVTEYFDEKLQAAICKIKRKGQTEHVSVFSIEDAKKAGLWNKSGVWTQYPKRMLQMRARGFALRDAFPDALQGLILVEEAQDHPKEATIVGDNNRTYASTTDKLIDKLSTTAQSNIVTEPEPETLVEPEPTLAEQLTILIDAKLVPFDVVEKWMSKANVKKISELSDDVLEKCIQYINENY